MEEVQSGIVTDIWLFVQTNAKEHAGTQAYLELAVTPDQQPGIELDTQGQQTSVNGISAPGTSAVFHWQATASWNLSLANLRHMDLEIEGNYSSDAWLPNSIWVVFGTSDAQVLVASYPNWGNNCFSSQSSDCGGKARQSYTLYPRS